MKTKISLVVLGFFLFIKVQAQTGNINASFGTGYFIEGVESWNTITASSVPNGTAIVQFRITDLTVSYLLDSLIDWDGSNGWGFQLNMGLMPSRLLDSLGLGAGVVVYAIYYDNNGNYLNYSPLKYFDIIPKPEWLKEVTISNVSVSSGKINMHASFPLWLLSNNSLPNDVLGLSGKSFQVYGNTVEFDIAFTMATKTSLTSNIRISTIVNIFDQKNYSWEIPIGNNTGISLNGNFNLSANFSDSYLTPKLELNMNSSVPIAPLVNANFGGGISLYGTVQGKVVLGQSGNSWGFIQNGNDITRITTKAEGSGFLRAGISAGYGAASANGILTIKGKIGGGLEYANVPSLYTKSLFGGEITVDGQVLVKTFWGLGPAATYGPKEFFNRGFGDYSVLKTGDSFDEIFGSTTTTFKANGTLTLPDNAPQPSFATRGNNLYAVWIEGDAQNQSTHLLFSKLNSNGNSFSSEIVVESNQHSISNPKIGIFPSGSAVITWSQSRYTASTVPSSAGIEDLIASQDIWFAFYDDGADEITYKSKIDDDDTSVQSGRAEGEANITMLSNSQGIITWIEANLTSNYSRVMYSVITEGSSNWTISNPAPLSNVSGINKAVNVVDLDTIVEALAVWINDPDGVDSTYNSQIYYSLWNGSSWTIDTQLTSPLVPLNFDELSMNSTDDYLAMAFTATLVYPNDSIVKRYETRVFDKTGKELWDHYFFDESNNSYFQKPRVAISDNGIILASYQSIPMFPDTNYVELGDLSLFARNLNTSGQWQEITNAIVAYDPNTFIWELTTGFGNGNNFYTLTQEYNEQTGIVTNPNNGVLFGDPDLSMVLRGLQIDNNLIVTDIAEPSTPTGIKKSLSDLPYVNLKQNYPNPVSDYTVIEYRILEPAFVELSIFDLSGRKIITLVNERVQPGVYQTLFQPGKIQSGTYLYKLRVDSREITKKMIIIN